MKKILALLLVLALTLTLVACGSGKKDAASTGSYKVAMVTDYGDITDQSFNQTKNIKQDAKHPAFMFKPFVNTFFGRLLFLFCKVTIRRN